MKVIVIEMHEGGEGFMATTYPEAVNVAITDDDSLVVRTIDGKRRTWDQMHWDGYVLLDDAPGYVQEARLRAALKALGA